MTTPAHRHALPALLLTALAAAGAGCTTSLKVSPLPASSRVEGITYFLPAKQFKVQVSFVVTDCLPARGVHGQPTLAVETSTSVVEEQFADTSRAYVLSYAELSQITKTTRFDISLTEAGTLAAVNAAIKDQTGEVMAGAAGAAFSLARAIALPDAMALMNKPQDSAAPVALPACAGTLAKRIVKLRQAEAEVLKAELAEVDLNDARGRRLKAAAALAEANGALEAAKAAKDPAAIKDGEAKVKAGQAAFNAAHDVVLRLGEGSLAQTRAKLLQARIELTASASGVVIPGQHSLPRALQPPPQALRRISDDPAELLLLKLLEASVEVDDGNRPPGAGADNGEGSSVEGLAYRMPAYSRLTVRLPAELLGSSTIAYEGIHAIPQFGRTAYLPLRNGPFQENSLAVVFGASGQLQKLTFDDKSSAERAVGSAKGAFDGYLAFVKGRAQDARDEEAAQLDLVAKRRDAQLDVLKDRLETLNTLNALESTRAGTADRSQRDIDGLTRSKQKLQLELEIRKLQDELAKLGKQ
jgi:hypothetical protein